MGIGQLLDRGNTPPTLYGLLEGAVPGDHSRQISAEYYIDKAYGETLKPATILDLGSGDGSSFPLFKRQNPAASWTGIDIDAHPNKPSLEAQGARLVVYEGVKMPFPDASFDMVYSKQVFEHVRFPAEVLADVNRVLKPGGWFAGSTSQLEPYHAHSLWNYTPYGFKELLNAAGLDLIEIRPGLDAMILILRRGACSGSAYWWTRETPLNRLIQTFANLTGKPPEWTNTVKLLFCGQFGFLAKKPSPSP